MDDGLLAVEQLVQSRVRNQAEDSVPDDHILALLALACCVLVLVIMLRRIEFASPRTHSQTGAPPDLVLPAAVTLKGTHRRERSLDLQDTAPGKPADTWHCATSGEKVEGLLSPHEVQAVIEAANEFKRIHSARSKKELMRGGWGDAKK